MGNRLIFLHSCMWNLSKVTTKIKKCVFESSGEVIRFSTIQKSWALPRSHCVHVLLRHWYCRDDRLQSDCESKQAFMYGWPLALYSAQIVVQIIYSCFLIVTACISTVMHFSKMPAILIAITPAWGSFIMLPCELVHLSLDKIYFEVLHCSYSLPYVHADFYTGSLTSHTVGTHYHRT